MDEKISYNSIEYYELLCVVQEISTKVSSFLKSQYHFFKKEYYDVESFQKKIEKKISYLDDRMKKGIC